LPINRHVDGGVMSIVALMTLIEVSVDASQLVRMMLEKISMVSLLVSFIAVRLNAHSRLL
jgi:hypothetical protein